MQQQLGLLYGELPEEQLTIPTDSLRLDKFGRDVISKNTLLAEEVSKLRRTLADEQAVTKVVEDQLARVKRWISSSEELTAKLVESDELQKAAKVEVASLEEEATCAGSQKA